MIVKLSKQRNRAEQALKRLGWTELEIYGTKDGDDLLELVIAKSDAALFGGSGVKAQ